MMEPNQDVCCLLCGGNAVLRYRDYPGYQEPLTFDIYSCTNCHTDFSLPAVNDTKEIYNNIYRHGAFVPAYKRYWKYAEDVKSQKKPLDYLANSEASYWGVREALRGIKKEKGSIEILEAGSGLGYLTYSLNKAGYHAFGLDISETSVEQAKKNYGQYYFQGDLFEYAGKSDKLFDVVLATEVIEHLEEPVAFIEALLKLLKPGGQIFLTTPNKSFFPEDIIWATENPPVHCWWFSEASMRYMAGKTGVKSHFVDLGGYYTRHYYWVDLKRFRNEFPQKPTFDIHGEVKMKSTSSTRSVGSIRHLLSTKSPWIYSMLAELKTIFLKRKNTNDPEIIVCQNRGVVLCAVFTK